MITVPVSQLYDNFVTIQYAKDLIPRSTDGRIYLRAPKTSSGDIKLYIANIRKVFVNEDCLTDTVRV